MFNTKINTEIEYKFWANITRRQFHHKLEALMEENLEAKPFMSEDDYYTSPGHEGFLRHRQGISFISSNRYAEVTVKRKINGNTVRKEVDINVLNNEPENIKDFLSLANYEFKFTVWKKAWVYHFEDCDVSYYTLEDGRDVIELEARPDAYTTLEEGVAIIDKWAGHLKLTDEQREARSLFEIFTDESQS
jgi:adenylate cyclase class IV